MREGWEYTTFEDVMTPAKSARCGDRTDLPILSITMRQGIIFQSDRFKKVLASKDTKDYKIIKNGQLVIAFPIDEGLIYTQDVAEEGIMSPAYNIWDVNYSKLNRKFLNLYFHCPWAMDYYKSKLRGTTQRRRMIPKEDLLSLPIPIPPLPLQEKIVSELDLLSGVIEKKRQQLKELDNLAQSIFYDMFGDPITNEMGWEVKKLGEVCTVNPPKKETSKGLSETDIVSFLPMEDLPIKACYHKPHQTRVFSEVQSSYTCFADNDVLMAKVTPCFENGKIGMASHLINGVGYGSSEFIVIRPNNTDVIKEFIYLFIQDQQFINNAITQFTGTSGLRRVPRQYVENCNIPIPPLPLQQSFAAKVEAIEQQKALIKQSLAETETLFNSRMEYYFGEGE